MVGGAQRRVIAWRAVAAGDEAHGCLAIHHQGQGLADAHVVERLLVASEVDVQELAGWGAQRLDAIGLGEALIFARRGREQQIDFTGDHCGRFGGAVRIDQQLDPVEVGPRRIVISGVTFDDDPAVGLVRRQLEWTGAVRSGRKAREVAGDDLGRNDTRVEIGECHRQVGIGACERELDGQGIDRGDLLDRADIGAAGRSGLRIEDRVDGGDDIVGGQRRTVMKRHARAQLEGPLGQRRVGLPGHREVRLDGHVRLQPGEVGVEQFGDEIFRVHARQHRMDDRCGLVD